MLPPPQKSTWCHVQGHNFAISGGIAPKISKDMPGILAMPRAKLHADRWCLSRVNYDRSKKKKKNKQKTKSKLSIPPTLHTEG